MKVMTSATCPWICLWFGTACLSSTTPTTSKVSSCGVTHSRPLLVQGIQSARASSISLTKDCGGGNRITQYRSILQSFSFLVLTFTMRHYRLKTIPSQSLCWFDSFLCFWVMALTASQKNKIQDLQELTWLWKNSSSCRVNHLYCDHNPPSSPPFAVDILGL